MVEEKFIHKYKNYEDVGPGDKKKLAQEVHDTFRRYSKHRGTWAENAQEDREFRLGRQWTKEQKDVLEARGQAPVVVNRIHPAVEAAKAMLTANRPQFRVSPREDSDNKVAQVMNTLLAYIFDISDGVTQLRQAIDDYYVIGMGCILAYQDPMKDDGKGEVCFHSVDPLEVYIDPNSRDRFCDDAECIIISRLFSKDQAKKLYPMYATKIKNATGEQTSDMPMTNRVDETIKDKMIFPEDINDREHDEYIRGYEKYEKIMVSMYRVYEEFSGKEHTLMKDEFSMYCEEEVAMVNNQIVLDPNQVEQLMQQGMPVRQTNKKELIEAGLIRVVEVDLPRIRYCVIMGDAYLYSRLLPTDKYPLVTFMNLHTRTPFPMSDVRMVKGLQEFINKTRSLIIAHATTSTNTKVLVPEGSVDMKEFEEKWAQPGVAIPFDPSDGQPVLVQPAQLSNELYQNEQTAKTDIDHQLGLYEIMQGNSQAAPQTYKATIAIDEFGQRKMKSKLSDIEAGLKRLGEVVIPLSQQLYTQEKTIRVINPNNSVTEETMNQGLVNDMTGEIEILNDVTIGKYDLIVVTGSTLPTNRYAQLELHTNLFQQGIIDQVEVLKKTEVYDMEGVLARQGEVQQLQGQIEQMEEQITDLEGDLQTRDRENVHLKQRVEVEKFKTQLNKTATKSDYSGKLFEKRLDDILSQISDDARKMNAERTKQSDTSTGKSSKKGKK
tara:strand:- start:1728 stop:3878 length:2151 start_codon:yes stop_codon:yes gene_type:complete